MVQTRFKQIIASFPFGRPTIQQKDIESMWIIIIIYLPSRRTFDRRLKTIFDDIRERISTMGTLFVSQDMVKPYILSVDSTLLRSKGKVWHTSSMKKGIIPCPGIDTDAR